MGLRFKDKESWQRWQASRRRLHVVKDRLLRRDSGAPSLDLVWWVRGTNPRLLVVCDSNSPTNHHSLLAPLEAAPNLDVVVAHPAHVDLQLPEHEDLLLEPGRVAAGSKGADTLLEPDNTLLEPDRREAPVRSKGWQSLANPDDTLANITAVATIGDHLATGAWAHGEARRRGWRQFVVQHGLLTPYSPPPPPGAELLAWSDADADYWTEGRGDLSAHTVGSALLASAASQPADHVSRFTRPVFLGQLHGAELSRIAMTRSVTAFWHETGCIYRPHPREEDKLSRAQHALWRRMGMEFDDSPKLSLVDRPVVSAFSTGVLEAAARGVPAWVFHLNPPVWLEGMWERYSMSRWGGAPAHCAVDVESAQTRIAECWKEI